MKKICHSIIVKLLFALILIFSFSMIGFGQIVKVIVPAEIPEQKMEEVIRKILVLTFKPRKQPAEIYLYEKGIKQTWLPKIKNIKFRLLAEKEFKQRNEVTYFFTIAHFVEDRYQIGLLSGTNCSAKGKSWRFRLTDQKVEVWQGGDISKDC